MGSPQLEVFRRQRRRGGDDRDLKHDVVEPVAGKRRFGTAHGLLPVAADNVFWTVVLVSHSSSRGTELRCCGTKPRCVKKPSAVSLASAVSLVAPRAAASFSSASQSCAPMPCPATAGWM